MKIQYKNRTYKQTNWPCCDCALAEWKVEFSCCYLFCPPFAKMECYGHAFKQKLFSDSIFNLQ